MQTNEQVAAAEETRIDEDKKRFRGLCRDFLTFEQGDAPLEEKQKRLMEIYDGAVDHFNICEQSVANSDLLGAHGNERWVRTKAESSLNTLGAIIQFRENFCTLFAKLNMDVPILSPTSYAAMQRIVAEYFPDDAASMRHQFVKNQLPTFGFDKPLPPSRRPDGSSSLEFDVYGIRKVTNVKSEDAKHILANYGNVTSATLSVSGSMKDGHIVDAAKEAKVTTLPPAKPSYMRSVFTEIAVSPVKLVVSISGAIIVVVILFLLRTYAGCQPFQQPRLEKAESTSSSTSDSSANSTGNSSTNSNSKSSSRSSSTSTGEGNAR